MRRDRYRRPERVDPNEETLPTDSVCTILTRQSTVGQRQRNVFSQEVDPKDLMREAHRLGFERVRVLDWDMGIGAYNTTIEDRPALHHWLTELLPRGESRVVMVSQEDRLFRDRTEIQVNRFIEQVGRLGGWVVCGVAGSRVYNFRRDMDKERFRLACKYGRQYIEFHIKGRLHPARERAALAGRYVGGPIPWGYAVEYDPKSPLYMRYVRYEPHATLVREHLFRGFAAMAEPSAAELARIWRREGLVFPFFGPHVDPRRVRWLDAHCRRDESRGGYPITRRQVLHVLTDVTYLGWRVRAGDVARDEAGRPKVCHEPLVEDELFWWCFDLLLPQRPEWAPPRPASHRRVVTYTRHVRTGGDQPGAVRFLAPGRVRCVVHGRRYSAVPRTRGRTQLCCMSDERELEASSFDCPTVPVDAVDAALCSAFAGQLTLSDGDVRELARLAQERAGGDGARELARLQREIAEQQDNIDRAKRRALQVEDDVLAADFLAEMRRARDVLRELEARARDARDGADPSAQAWRAAERAYGWAERIRATFAEWPRYAQERVLALALGEGVIGRVGRYAIGLWLRWEGGAESRVEIASPHGERIEWTDEELGALRRWYAELSTAALGAMLPSRTFMSIQKKASILGLRRGGAGEGGSPVPPVVIRVPESPNAMAAYGFPLVSSATGSPPTEQVSGAISGRRPSRRPRGAAWRE